MAPSSSEAGGSAIALSEVEAGQGAPDDRGSTRFSRASHVARAMRRESLMRSSFPSHSRLRRNLLPAVVASVLAAAVVGGERSAAAQVVEVTPPALRVEVLPPRPSFHHAWIPGYWGWRP